MANKSRNRKNEPPSGEGKRRSRNGSEPRKLAKRSEVAQAQRSHPEVNMGGDEAEAARREGDRKPGRDKKGR